MNEHNVAYASNAKKAELVDLFDRKIAPKAAQLLTSHQQKMENGSGEGFENVSELQLETPKPKKKRGRPKKVSPKDESSPIVPQKRTQEESNESLKKKKTSPPSLAPSSGAKRNRGHLFDDNSSFSDDDFFATKIKRSPAKSAIKEKLDQVKEESPIRKKQQKQQVESPQFKTLKEEEDSFEHGRALIKDRKLAEMAADLGVTIHGTPPKDFKLEESSFESKISDTPKRTPRKSPLKSASLTEKKKTPKTQTPVKSSSSPTLSLKLTPAKDTPKIKDTPKAKETPKSSKDTPKARDTSKGPKDTPKSSKVTPKSSKVTPKSSKATPKSATPKRTPRKTPSKGSATPKKAEHSVIEEESDDESDEETDETHHKSSNSRKKSFWSPFFFISLWLLAVVYGLGVFWYREQQYLVCYCGQEIEQATVPPNSHPLLVSAGAYLDANFKPRCTPCPPHARCYPYLELGCYEDFVETQPWYFRLTPTLHTNLKRCVPDTKKAEKLEIMIDVALDLLRSRNAEKNCGRTSTDDFEAGLTSTEVHDLLLMMKAPYITRDEFEELWERSVIELEKEPEVIVRQVSTFSPFSQPILTQTGFSDGVRAGIVDNSSKSQKTSDKILRSTSLSNLSFKCRILNTVIGTVVHYKGVLLAMVAVYFIVLYVRYRIRQYRLQRLRVETVYYEVLRNLKKQYNLAKQDPSIPLYIGSTQLRDLILTTEKNLSRKLKLWNRVSSEVENNSNVRYHLVEHHGEIMKVWEWITDVDT